MIVVRTKVELIIDIPLNLLKEKIDGYLEGIGTEMDPHKKEEFASSLLYISNMSKNISIDDSPNNKNLITKQLEEKSRFLMEKSMKLKNLKKHSKKFSEDDQFEGDIITKSNGKDEDSNSASDEYYKNKKAHLNEKTYSKENSSLISALGNGQILMTSSGNVDQFKQFKSEDILNKDKHKQMWDKDLLQKEVLLTTSGVRMKQNNLEVSEDMQSCFNDMNKNYWKTEEIKEVESEKESFDEQISGKELMGDLVKQDQYSVNNSSLIKPSIKNKDFGFPISQVQENHLKSIMSEPTVIIKSSIAINAEKKFKQVDSTVKLDSINNQFQTKEFSTKMRKGSFNSSDNNIKLLRNNSKLKGSNQMIEEFKKLMESQPEVEQKIILENIANNTNSSLKISKENHLLNKMENFESFSQTEKTFEDTQKLSELPGDDAINKICNKDNNNDEPDINSDFLEKTLKENSLKKSIESFKTGSIISKSDQLQMLIQKDSEKMSNSQYKERSVNRFDSEDEEQPSKERTNNEKPMKLFQKIKKSNLKKNDNYLNFKKKKEIHSNDEDSEINNEHSIWNVIKNFSKTTNFIEEKKMTKNFELDNLDEVFNLKQSENLLDKLKKKPRKKISQVLKFKNDIKKITDKQKLNINKKSLIKSKAEPLIKNDFTFKSPLKKKLLKKKLSQSGIYSPLKNSLMVSPKNSNKKGGGIISSSRKLKFSVGNLNEMITPTLENSSILRNKKCNFSQKKIESGVFDRLSQPKNPIVKLKGSVNGIKGVLSKNEENDSSKKTDTTTTPNELIFDSSLIKLDQIRENMICFEKKKQYNIDEDKQGEKATPPPNSLIPKEKLELKVEEVEQVIKSPKKKKKIRRKRAKTPTNSLIEELRHLKPIKREAFVITKEDLNLFYSMNKNIEQQKGIKEEIHIKKQYKNFFEDENVEEDNQPISPVTKPEDNNIVKINAENFHTWRKESPIKKIIKEEGQQKVIDTPRNIFKETKENAERYQQKRQQAPLIDVEFSDKYQNYKKDMNSDMMTDDQSDLTSFTELSEYNNITNSLTNNDFNRMNFHFQKKIPSQTSSKQRNFKKKPGLSFQNQFQSERKNNLTKKQFHKKDNNWLKKNSPNSSKLRSFYNSRTSNKISKQSSLSSLKRRSHIPDNIYQKHKGPINNSLNKKRKLGPEIIYSDNYPFYQNSKKVHSMYGSPERNRVHLSRDFTSINSNQTFSHSQISQRPIININLGNNPVENLKIVSIPNETVNNKDAMTIQLSYTPKNLSKQNSKTNNIISIDGDKIETNQSNFNEINSFNGGSSIVKKILSKRKSNNNSFALSNQHNHTYQHKGQLNRNRINRESLSGFQNVSHDNLINSSFTYQTPNQSQRFESNFSSKNEDNMMNSNMIDHGTIAEMIQNEDDEIMKVLTSKEKMYKITFAESKRSQDTKEMLKKHNPFRKLSSMKDDEEDNKFNIYQDKQEDQEYYNPTQSSFSRRKSLSSSKSNSSSTSKYKYVYVNNTLKKINIEEEVSDKRNYYEESNEYESEQLEIMNLQDTFPSTIITKEISEISGSQPLVYAEEITKSHTIQDIRRSLDTQFVHQGTFNMNDSEEDDVNNSFEESYEQESSNYIQENNKDSFNNSFED